MVSAPSGPQRTIRESPAATETTALLRTRTPSPMPRRSHIARVVLAFAAVCCASALAATPWNVTHTTVAPPDAPRELLLDLYTRCPLLDAVQRAGLFNDSKHFVDMPVKINSTPSLILNEFSAVIQPLLHANPSATNATLTAFLNKHFDSPESDIQHTVPADFTLSPSPPLIAAIPLPPYRQWALDLHALWKELGRSPRRDVASSYLHPTPLASLGDTAPSTLIVVPGGRFRESYYWDSYWIVQGLVVSNMHATARRVVQNLLEYVAEFGFVPNGGRLYYLTRSQPPMLSDMVRTVARTNGSWDRSYLRVAVPLLEKEYMYWMTTHRVDLSINGVRVKLNQYKGTTGAPRPESYREDVQTAETAFPNNTAKQSQLYNDLIAAAESGWDFSSRWFRDRATLAAIDTTDVVPVDLNAILYRVESNLAEFHTVLGNSKAATRFKTAASARARALDVVFWDDASSSWRDVDVKTGAKSPVVSVSNYFPLWAGAYGGINETVDLSQRLSGVVQSLRSSGLIQVAGVQTTTTATTQQWDAPNAWPPLQDILIEGLLQINATDARDLARELVRTWINTSFAAWTKTGLMFEKYDATIVGGLGAGGEYVPQFGFGWTNGVVLKFLTAFQDLWT